jgi:hypothetical protein
MIRSVAPKRIEPYLITLFYSIPRYSLQDENVVPEFFWRSTRDTQNCAGHCRRALPDDRPIPLGQTHAAGRNNDVRASRSSRRRLGYPGSIDNHLILKCFMSKERDRVLVIAKIKTRATDSTVAYPKGQRPGRRHKGSDNNPSRILSMLCITLTISRDRRRPLGPRPP